MNPRNYINAYDFVLSQTDAEDLFTQSDWSSIRNAGGSNGC